MGGAITQSQEMICGGRYLSGDQATRVFAADPDATLLEFLQSSYSAAADLGAWDRASLDRPPEQWPGARAT